MVTIPALSTKLTMTSHINSLYTKTPRCRKLEIHFLALNSANMWRGYTG